MLSNVQRRAREGRSEARHDASALWFPALDNAIEQAALIGSGRDASQYIPIANDLHIAWREAVVCTRTALARNLTSPTSGVPSLDAWLLATDSDVRNIRAMPQKAQRELSASVKAIQGLGTSRAALL